MKRIFPKDVYNLISLIGVGLALFGLAAVIILFLLSIFAHGENPYLGIFTFLVFPAILVFGLLLIPVGMLRERRRRERGETRSLVLDMSNSHHRNATVAFIAGTSVFLLVTTIGLYEGFHYAESQQFCGEVCHAVMEPEYTAYLNSSHANVTCVSCHIGPGAGWYVKSKMSGARQVFKTAMRNYPSPIPTPIEQLRPAREVCEQCHWPEKFHSKTEVTNNHFLGDGENTRWQLQMLVNVGGTSASPSRTASGIHWHIDSKNEMTYVASDEKRQAFDQVTWWRDGEPVVYALNGEPLSAEELAEKRAEGLERTMDCMDCHNRPAHNYGSPMTTVNEAMFAGLIDPSIPYIKREAVKALTKTYSTRAGARDSIALALETFYAEDAPPRLGESVAAVLDIHARHFFPEMKVRWDVYPDNSSHLIAPGCFRCHGSELETAEGETISNDCNLCHTILAQGPPDSLSSGFVQLGMPFQHPVDIDGAETEMPCYDCHLGDDSLY